ncbi:phosphoglycerate mutase, 2,3-biphosphateglycerate-independent type [Natronomonas pharaonis DSM 2160]|uniref:2,3-bisphosphoglycerate-independent phosphoglycerate mutase n=1 Tax=Natronomonas pharaonis (strain ATCC 35678 / DSM 2160 / CIP 103997 / JCM 8858 / NBRC 14720 / NCIMB 2260 / Gabara) TaxID=348780 RepID=GPMI_NATPD|nr:2,3-bisphosphoglycerate-independent phosphoglycerate mutase [Natronomonas pharaonis]Q3IS17.1 RecName: Full=2,3-bisphosphoglycerate-independent phosphoglycerate mutase; Short=BPG-independent PGAM; Short=Phosphoglyceromutase; Short=iPGM [Natronomonas pharaonis DSM 2160]CAI49073.1 phosphoglycerate mutase, 2,3-biphosphateglycerate-independent type [Natronomonas pharaonis DSM 2160]
MEAALVILDGWGLGDGDETDAVAAADTPAFDALAERGATGQLETHGRSVGLPDGQMGNSEVGHLNIGAGRVVKQDSTRVTDDIDAGVFADNEALARAFDHADDHDGRVHFMGLVSDGGVHSYQSHLHALVDLAAERGVEAVTHAFTDGRDTAPKSGVGFIEDLAATVEEAGTGDVATVCGRYYAMDRDENWERTKRAYDAIVHREAPHEADSAVAAVAASYDRGDTDEYVEPTLVSGTDAPLSADDAVVFFNFRADRARQLVRMLADIDPDWAFETDPPAAALVTMTEYDETFDLPVAYPPLAPEQPLGAVLAESDRTQLRMAESEKYAHVTYFLNGGREVAFEGERRDIVDSPDVPTYDEQPAMSAPELTDAAIDHIGADAPDVLVLNYANPDMVGHTGDFEAAKAAIEAVDEQLGRLESAIREAGGHLFVTADHGNADDMGTPEAPHTAHTTNPVPFVYCTPDGTDGGYTVRDGGTLADIAPTLLSTIGVDIPETMTGESLLER